MPSEREGHSDFHLPPAQFTTTHWSVVLAAGQNSPSAAAALEKLCRAY